MQRLLRSLATTLAGLTCVLALGFDALPAEAGGSLRGNDFTGFPNLPPGPTPGSLKVSEAPMRWDLRCLPAEYRLNTATSPNAAPLLDTASTQAVLQTALDAWNSIPTSYIDLQMRPETVDRPRLGAFDYFAFDMVNEANFLSGQADGWVAISPSIALTASVTLTVGFDLDGDGDSDVFDPASEGVEVCVDIDGDGDTDLPAGFYEAGTIVDNDVSFNNSLVWTTGPPNAVFGEFDLEATAVHEFGHSHGLAHSAINQHSKTDGTGPSMYPLIFSTDAAFQESLRTPATDDVAWSSFTYPEGTADSGQAALQPGDVAFDAEFGIITGTITDGESGLPLVGGHLFAVDRLSGRVVTSVYTGRIEWVFVPGSFFGVLPDFPEEHLVGGEYTLPVPHGLYNLAIEALDGAPVVAGNVESAPFVGDFFGQQDFNEQYLTRQGHSGFRPRWLYVRPGETLEGIDHTVRSAVNLDGFDTVGAIDSLDFDQLGFFGLPPSSVYAVEVPADEVALLLDAGLRPTGAAFRTWGIESSVPVRFANAALVGGRVVEGTAEIDRFPPLAWPAWLPGQNPFEFLGQENDFAPLFFDNPRRVARRLERAIDHGAESFFLVLELPETFEGPLEAPPGIGLDFGQEVGLLGRSYLSTDGGESFFPVPAVNFMFRLIFE